MGSQITGLDKLANSYNLFTGAAITILSAVFGQYWYLFATFLIFNIIDFLTGWAKSRKLQQVSSQAGAKGILKKVCYWAVIAVAFLISDTFIALGTDLLQIDLSFLLLLGWFTLATYMVNEARSIVENCVEMGVNVPQILVKGLAITALLLEKENSVAKLDEEGDDNGNNN